jgi:hypothetical protein
MNKLLIAIGILILVGIYFFMQHNNTKHPIIKDPTFIEASTFSGSKKGYVYKRDSQGLGYYLDKINDNII